MKESAIKESLSRRDILRYTALITGSAVSASLAGVILSGCSPEQSSTQASSPAAAALVPDESGLHYFSAAQFALVTVLADTWLPRTDSPSATDVDAHKMLDAMIGQVFDNDYKTRFANGWRLIEDWSGAAGFSAADESARADALRAVERGEDAGQAALRAALLDIKQQLVAYYLGTAEVAKKFLNYLPIPVEYKPCISIDEVNNKAWAL